MSRHAGPGGRPGEAGPAERASAVPALIGRDGEVAVLDDQVRAVCDGAFRVVLIEGAAGIGKSRLATEVQTRHAHRVHALSARCYRWGATSSFGPWVEALDRDLRRRPSAELARLCAGMSPELGVLLPTLAPAIGPHAAAAAPSGDVVDRARLLEGLVDLFDRLSAERPVVVGLDDVHLADPSTWEALRYLGRRLADAPIGVFATARPAELAPLPLAGEVLTGLEDDGLLVRLSLAPLTPAEITALAHEVLRRDARARSTFVPATLVSWLVARSMGHPLFAIGLLQALIEEGSDLVEPRLERLPTSLRERVSLDLAALGEEDRRLLEILAVADRRMDVSDLAQVVELEGAVEEAIERLARLHLVAEQRNGVEVSVEISHPIVQDAIYERIAEARRRTLHRRVARALVTTGHLGAAAGHVARAAEPGDDEAVAVLCQALAHAEAHGLYQEGLAMLAALLDILPAADDRWLTVLAAMDPRSEWVLSHLAENDAATAIAAMERIEGRLAGSEDLAARARVQFHLASLLSFGAGRASEAARACDAARRLFERAGERDAALLAANEQAWIRGTDGALREQQRIATEVLETAEAEGHLRVATQSAATAAYAAGFLGRVAESDTLFDRALALAAEEGNRYRTAWVTIQRSCVLGLAGRLGEAVADAEAVLRDEVRAPDALGLEVLAHGRWLAGDLERALEALERSAVRRPVRGSRRRAWGAALAARIHVERGQHGRARTSLALATATYADRPFLVWGFWPRWTAAILHWATDGPGTALDPLTAVADQLAEHGIAPYEALVLVDLAQAAAEVGEGERSVAAAERCAVVARTAEGALVAGCVELTAALAALATGERGVAGERAASAHRQLAPAGYRLLAATAQQVRAQAVAPDDRPAAVAALEEAASTFAACGAVWRRDRVTAELARLGSRGRRAAAAVLGPAALTPREREVAALAAQGFTAREIGERLFIGRRTVETHLATSYAKLGVDSKRELIRRAAELDLDPDGAAP